MTLPFRSHFLLCVAVVLALGKDARAASNYAPPPQQEEGFADRMGGFFRRLFQPESPQYAPQPVRPAQQGSNTTGATRYNLDRPPEDVDPANYNRPPVTNRVSQTPPAQNSNKPAENKRNPVTTTEAPKHSNEGRTRSSDKREAPPASTRKNTHEDPPRKTDKSTASSAAQTSKPSTKPASDQSNKTEKPVSSNTAEVSKPDKKTTPTTAQTNKPVIKPAPDQETKMKPAEEKSTTASTSDGPPSKQTEPPASKPAAKETLTATRTNKSGRVKSPYPPYNELDVTGLPSGAMAMDPTTNRIFRVP